MNPPITYRAARHARRRGWYKTATLIDNNGKPWWDWGNRLYVAAGDGDGEQPEPPTWFYRETSFRHHRGISRTRFEVIKSYREWKARTRDTDQEDNWQAFSANQDGDVIFGRMYWGNGFHGLKRSEVRLLRRYLRAVNRSDWFGLRRLLWGIGLHHTVHLRKPFACNHQPHAGVGTPPHWRCHLPRRHDGTHQRRGASWDNEGNIIR